MRRIGARCARSGAGAPERVMNEGRSVALADRERYGACVGPVRLRDSIGSARLGSDRTGSALRRV